MSDAKRIMYLFPGQGSQYRGIGSDIAAEFDVAKRTYEEAGDILGFDVAKLSFEDPGDEIGLTRNTQPVLLTHQVACLRVFDELTGSAVSPALAAGHSLGEYTALVAAGALSFADGLRLVRRRGELMGEHGEGGMLALALAVDEAKDIADRFFCQVASCNLPLQTVIGGADADLEAAAAWLAETMPKKRTVMLATEGAFHTYFMVTAAREFREVLDATAFSAPRIEVLSNYTGGRHDTDPDTIRTRLFFQLFNPVNWVGCLQTAMAAEVDTYIEFGGGIGSGEGPAEKRPNLESIVKKSTRRAPVKSAYLAAINVATLRETAAALTG